MASGANMAMQGNVPGDNSGLSALQILSSFGGANGNAETMPGIPTATQIPPNHFGTWVVNMNGNQMVKLVLQPNIRLCGSSSKKVRITFGRTVSIGWRAIGARSIQRPSANGWHLDGNGSNFTFKLDGVPDSGMPFVVPSKRSLR